MVNVFYVPVFFIVFRETLETSIVVSILLAFLRAQLGQSADAAIYKRLRNQVWLGTGLGLFICVAIGSGLIGAFYSLGKDIWSKAESLWEGIFSLIAAIIITIMGAALLRVSKMQTKWKAKLEKALKSKENPGTTSTAKFKIWCEKYAMFILPFVTVLREGLEAVVFIGGISLGAPASSIPVPTITGILAGFAIGFLIYKGGNMVPLQIFLIVSTCFLYLVAAGLFSRSIGFFEQHKWNLVVGGEAAEQGAGPGSYDYRQSVWHVNCCSPQFNGGGGWGVFNALFGWTNSATYGTVLSYNFYWIAVIVGFLALMYREKKGHWPLQKPKAEPIIPLMDIEEAGETTEVSRHSVQGKQEA
ncbi:high-affinity iron permease [Ophidiomyces ophidiicola]|uniref:High-affinity iron permease n=1 Tax=Ophidiomyces ophidiicola TaxID=1387563 RepID=A0ACB8UX03_9EURO|nr:high-affinity iron permease [Ophidiomyces ophidiicola]KAI1914122.1 high-affinity iron permease [Ophidiomyces ophidiicola]KAI1916403.1 high-affinity iron permease [Ophidiomyces ophidiicola]KAI1923839.1 high-affinity iron permease [Ophidiomyces ophidiicola]KAI1940278.1 high-affinity iron permease [Ophidiomyces ophidiicola]KAI1945643.1 high-affinity iron permease [Ophidiomyces ophidiicola]